jgi:predicted transcriptional regulator
MNFKQEIKKRGLKQVWIADKLGISTAMMSFYLSKRTPMPENVEQSLKEILK